MGAVRTLKLNGTYAEDPLNDALDIRDIIDVDHIDTVDGPN
jgi:hypothetical protein